MSEEKMISLIGFASGIAAGDVGTGDGPPALAASSFVETLKAQGLPVGPLELLFPRSGAVKMAYDAIAELNERLAARTKTLTAAGHPFVVIGGDHSSAIGTWSGAAAALKAPMGLIWIDAHLDSHTPESSESGHIHGMPLAVLLGKGAEVLTRIGAPQAKVLPEHVSLIGIRSYESGEMALIKSLGIRIYRIDEVESRGFDVVFQEALTRAKTGTQAYGLTFDLDAIDPLEAPGVGTPEPGGLRATAVCEILKTIRGDPDLIGLEIAEFNPHHDEAQRTEQLIQTILQAVYGTSHS